MWHVIIPSREIRRGVCIVTAHLKRTRPVTQSSRIWPKLTQHNDTMQKQITTLWLSVLQSLSISRAGVSRWQADERGHSPLSGKSGRGPPGPLLNHHTAMTIVLWRSPAALLREVLLFSDFGRFHLTLRCDCLLLRGGIPSSSSFFSVVRGSYLRGTCRATCCQN